MSLESLAGETRFTVIDLETTGLDPLVDSIVEMAAIRLEGGVETARWESLVDPGPGAIVSDASLALHGLGLEQLRGAPSLEAALASLRDFVAGSAIVAHNAPFDLGFLHQAAVRTGTAPLSVPVIDTLEMAREVYPEQRSHKLEALCRALGREASRFHRAADDAGHLAAIFPTLWHRWQQRRAWHRAQFHHIDQVGRRFEAVTRLMDTLQLELGELRRTLTLYLESHPAAQLELGDGTVLTRSSRETWDYDPALLVPLLEAWGVKDRLLKLDRQRLDRWLAGQRFTAEQREAILATRVAGASPPRLLRQVCETGAPQPREART